MIERTVRLQRGFTLIEMAVVVLILGVLIAFATPKFTNAMREYRVSMASRQLTDLIQRAKTQAVSDNRKVVVRVDTAGNRAGLVVYDSAGVELRTEYVKLPQGVLFTRPANVTAPMTGAPTAGSVSFPAKVGSTTVFEQEFNSRGFPVVTTPATINALYVGNGTVFRALTLTSVGGIRSWKWNNTVWTNTRTAQ